MACQSLLSPDLDAKFPVYDFSCFCPSFGNQRMLDNVSLFVDRLDDHNLPEIKKQI
jgi:hypothetical protein